MKLQITIIYQETALKNSNVIKPFNPKPSKLKNLFGFEDEERKNKFGRSMHIVDDLRISPFMPIDKITKRSRTWQNFVKNNYKVVRKTSWGKVEIRSRLLTQKHFEVFSAVMAKKKYFKKVVGEDNIPTVAVYFSMKDIADQLELEWGGWTKEYLEEKVKEMYDVSIIRIRNNGDQYAYKLFTRIKYKSDEDIWGVTLDPEYASIFEKTLTINYAERLREITNISGEGSALVKAIIQHFITHQIKEGEYQRIRLMQMLETVGYETDDRMVRRAITAINKNAEELGSFGVIFYKKDRILEYSGTGNISFIPAIKEIIN